MLITILCSFFQNFCHSCFLGKFGAIIWISSNWLKSRVIHCYMFITVLMFIFSKLFSFIFCGRFGPKIWSSLNWLVFGTEVDCYMLILILMFIFPKFLSFIFFGQIWSQNLKFSKLTEIWCRGTSLYGYYDFNVYFFKIFVIHIILQIFGSKIWCCRSWPQSSICGRY